MFEMTLFITLYVMVERMNSEQDCQTKKEKEKYKKENEREGDSERERTRKVPYPNLKSRA